MISSLSLAPERMNPIFSLAAYRTRVDVFLGCFSGIFQEHRLVESYILTDYTGHARPERGIPGYGVARSESDA